MAGYPIKATQFPALSAPARNADLIHAMGLSMAHFFRSGLIANPLRLR